MRREMRLIALVAIIILGASSAPAVEPSAIPDRPGLARFGELSGVGEGIARFEQTPTAEDVDALRDLGLVVQPMTELPLALVRGSISEMVRAVEIAIALDVYPNEQLRLASATSNAFIGADVAHELGLKGQGTTVAVMDTGIDATHPDLAGRVKHNWVFLSPEEARLQGRTKSEPIFVAADEGPHSDTDTLGHGTLVAGVIAATGTSDPELTGVAPETDLISYNISKTGTPMGWAVITAYDHLLARPEYGVDVINNSWAGWVNFFDIHHPINVATKAAADAGMIVVFAAGNHGWHDTEMTWNEYGLSVPWIISATGLWPDGRYYRLYSQGFEIDNATAAEFVDRSASFDGDRIGIYRPTVAAPGVAVTTTCKPLQLYPPFPPCEPGRSVPMDGTSIASPHVAGVAALLRQARPSLTVEQAIRVLEATARPVARTGTRQVGYGSMDAAAAIELVQRDDFEQALAAAHQRATARVLGDRPWRVQRSELHSWTVDPATVRTVTEAKDVPIEVNERTDAIKLTLNYPVSTTDWTGLHSSPYTVIMLDADGREVGRSGLPPSWLEIGMQVEPIWNPAVVSAIIDLRGTTPAYGNWTIRVEPGTNTQEAHTLTADPYFSKKGVLLQAALLEAA